MFILLNICHFIPKGLVKGGPWLFFWSLVPDSLRFWRKTIKDCERSKSKIWGRRSALTNWHLAQIPVVKDFSAFLMRGSLVRVNQNGKIPSELEVASRYNCWHCWHCWQSWHCWPCWHCWHGVHCWHGLHCWPGLHCWHGLHCSNGSPCSYGWHCWRGLHWLLTWFTQLTWLTLLTWQFGQLVSKFKIWKTIWD